MFRNIVPLVDWGQFSATSALFKRQGLKKVLSQPVYHLRMPKKGFLFSCSSKAPRSDLPMNPSWISEAVEVACSGDTARTYVLGMRFWGGGAGMRCKIIRKRLVSLAHESA